MIRACLFDLGNVLVFFSHARMCAQIAGVCGRTEADVQRLLFDSGLQWDFERGRVSEREYHQRLETLLERELHWPALRTAGADIFDLNADILPVLDAVKSQGIRLVLLSNTSVTHFEFVRERFDLLHGDHPLALNLNPSIHIIKRNCFANVALRKAESKKIRAWGTRSHEG